KSAWQPPVIVAKQSSTTFSDKEQIWADNASSSRFFGNVYVCWAAFRGQEKSSNAAPAPLQVAVSRDGGETWSTQQIGAAANNRIVMSYVSGEITKPHVYFAESTDSGATWSAPRSIEGATDRGYYAAPAISPDGKNVYVVYNAFTLPYQPTTGTPRSLVGVFMQATATGTAATGNFAEMHRGTAGDPRGSSQNNLVRSS